LAWQHWGMMYDFSKRTRTSFLESFGAKVRQYNRMYVSQKLTIVQLSYHKRLWDCLCLRQTNMLKSRILLRFPIFCKWKVIVMQIKPAQYVIFSSFKVTYNFAAIFRMIWVKYASVKEESDFTNMRAPIPQRNHIEDENKRKHNRIVICADVGKKLRCGKKDIPEVSIGVSDVQKRWGQLHEAEMTVRHLMAVVTTVRGS